MIFWIKQENGNNTNRLRVVDCSLEKLRVTFDSKETVLELNGCTIEASHQIT